MGRLKKIIGAFLHAPGRFDELAKRIADTNDRIGSVEKGFREQLNRMDIDWYMDQLCENREALGRLNRGLSIAPTVWGDPERLEIDETAKVFTCFFNTNSGRIRIGEATFAGSGVSILTGSHDMQLTGTLRRDAEKTEGCDIEIGKGVWLASGCTILGPCRIGDNAVIAAGAVVTPGTEVPANTVWGGVPAKQIKAIDPQETSPENPAVQEVFAKSEGILFTEGWGEKIPGLTGTPGCWLYKKEGKVLTDRAEWILQYRREGVEKGILRMTGPEGEETVELKESEGQKPVRLPVAEGALGEVTFIREQGEKVFVALKAAGKGSGEAEEEDDEETEIDIDTIMREIKEEAKKHDTKEKLPEF